MIAVVAGGVGAARLLRGMVEVVNPAEIVAIVNVADDFDLHGLRICPDIDTVRSTLADDVGEQGWGRAGETWTAMRELTTLARYAPEGSQATDWFSLGDRDLAVHLYRTQRLAEGAGLAQVTDELTRAQGVGVGIVPATEDHVATRVRLASGEWVDFQHYFVRLRHAAEISDLRIDGLSQATPALGVVEALENADRIVIAPSNPFVSIAPVIGVTEIGELLKRRRKDVIAVSPIVDGRAVKGPAASMFSAFGMQPSVESVALMWNELCSTLVIDVTDANSATNVTAAGVTPVVAASVMDDVSAAAQLSRSVLRA